MRGFIKAIGGLVLPLGLLACGGPGAAVTHTTFYDYRFYPQQIGAAGGPIPVELRGAPEGLDEAAFIGAIRPPAYVNRAVVPAKPGESGPRLVIAFARASGEALCAPRRGPAAAAASATGLTLSGAYCVSRIPFSSAITDAGGGEPAQAANQLVRVLLPQFNPEHRRRLRGDG